MADRRDPSPRPTTEALVDALARIPPRDAHLLTTLFIKGHSFGVTAAEYGTTPDAMEVLILRAARLLQQGLRSSGDAPVLPRASRQSSADERADAARLRRALASRDENLEQPQDDPRSTSDTFELSRTLSTLRAAGREILSMTEARARAEEGSPRTRHLELLRRGAVLALIAAAVWLYLRGR